MTFETEEGYKRALNYKDEVDGNSDKYGDDIKKWIGVHDIEIQPASEPSDIIWENRHFTPFDRKKKELVVYTIITLMLFISFIIIVISLLVILCFIFCIRFPLLGSWMMNFG